MRHHSLAAGALGLSMAWVMACGDNATEPTQPAELATLGPESVVGSDTWIARKNLPSGRIALALAPVTNAAGQSIVYAIGGITDAYPRSPLRTVTAYNVATNTWTTRRPLPVPLFSSNGAGVINGKIYVSGGFSRVGDDSPTPTRALYVYDPGTNTWTRKHDLPWIGSPTKDWTVGSGGVTGVINGKLYVVTNCSSLRYYTEGGYCEGDLIGPRLFRYDPVTDRWATRPPPFPGTTDANLVYGQLAGGVIGGKLYVMGGDYSSKGHLAVYDPATNRWTAKNALGLARNDVAAAVLDNKLYVMGGARYDPVRHLSEILAITIVYDPVTDLWTRRASMPSPRLAMAGATVLLNGKPRIEVVGGSGDSFRDPRSLAADNLQYIP
jgi:hypothetical protein